MFVKLLNLLTNYNLKLNFFLIVLMNSIIGVIDVWIIQIIHSIKHASEISNGFIYIIAFRFIFYFIVIYVNSKFIFKFFDIASRNVYSRIFEAKNYSIFQEKKDERLKFLNAEILIVARGFLSQILTVLTETVILMLIIAGLVLTVSGELVLQILMCALPFALLQLGIARISSAQGSERSAADEGRYRIAREAGEFIDHIALFPREKFLEKRYHKFVERFSKSLLKSNVITQSMRLQIELFIACLALLVMLFSSLSLDEVFSTLAVVAFVTLRTVPSINKISAAYQQLKFSEVGVDDLLSFGGLNVESIHKEQRQFEGMRVQSVSKAHVFPPFTYYFEPGKSYAITGPSGSGKSTFMKIILGLDQNYTGKIELINTTSFKNINFAFVAQKIVLFHGTLLENIFMKPASEVSSLELDFLIELLSEFGLHYLDPSMICASDGSNFSGGERQRLNVIRALVRRPSIILMDEFTSALDQDVANRVLQICREKVATLIVITHDQSLLQHVDQEIKWKGDVK